MKSIIDKTAIVFALCALSLPSLHSMQRLMCQRHVTQSPLQTIQPTLQKLRYCTTHNSPKVEINKNLHTQANRLFFKNVAMGTANIIAACATQNPYFLLPLIPQATSIVGIGIIKSCVNNKSSEPELIRDLECFIEKRKSTIENLLHNIDYTDKQMLVILSKYFNEGLEAERNFKATGAATKLSYKEHVDADRAIIKTMKADTELSDAYKAIRADRKKLEYELENLFIKEVEPIFNTHKNADLDKWLIDSQKKINNLITAWLFNVPSWPLAILPTFIRNTKNPLHSFDVFLMSLGTLVAASVFPLFVAASIANMEVAFRNKSFFNHNVSDQKKNLKQIMRLIKLHQDHTRKKNETIIS